MINSFDISMLDRNTQDALYLVWVSCKDFKALNNADNQQRLNSLWASIKNQVSLFFVNQEVTWDSIVKDFHEMVVNIDPYVNFGYNTERNALLFNLWALFFDVTDTTCVTPAFPWKLAAELVHEHDHFLFFKSAGLLGKEKKEQDEFDKKNWPEVETRAFSAQAKFLEGCKEKVSSALLHELRINGWMSEGKPYPNSYYKCTIFPNERTLKFIDGCIADCTDKIKKIKEKYKYPDEAKKNNLSHSVSRRKILSLPVDLNKLKEPFPEVKLQF